MPSRPAVSASARRLPTCTTRPGAAADRGLDLGHARAPRARSCRATRAPARSGRRRRWPSSASGGRGRVGGHDADPAAPAPRRPATRPRPGPTTASPPMSAFRVTGVDRGRQHPADRAEQPARLVERLRSRSPSDSARPTMHEVAERVARELAASRSGARTRPATGRRRRRARRGSCAGRRARRRRGRGAAGPTSRRRRRRSRPR